jgi:hypothetical protein
MLCTLQTPITTQLPWQLELVSSFLCSFFNLQECYLVVALTRRMQYWYWGRNNGTTPMEICAVGWIPAPRILGKDPRNKFSLRITTDLEAPTAFMDLCKAWNWSGMAPTKNSFVSLSAISFCPNPDIRSALPSTGANITPISLALSLIESVAMKVTSYPRTISALATASVGLKWLSLGIAEWQ